LLATDTTYCKDDLGYSPTLEDEMRESAADLIKDIVGYYKTLNHESILEIWLGNWCEMVAMAATDAAHVAAFLADYASC